MTGSDKNHILLICHSEDSGKEIISLLEEVNAEIITAVNTADVISKISFFSPKLIITETFFGNENCYDLCRMLKKTQKTKLVPIIAISDIDCQVSRIQAIQSGADTFMIRPIIKDELLAHVRGKISQFNEFYILSTTDELTRLFNRREFFKRFEREIINNQDSVISLAILDLDSFKHINDQYGHPVGDSVLIKFGEILNNNLSNGFFPTRFGGEEFVITLCGYDGAQAKEKIDSLRSELEAVVFTSSDNKCFSVSFSAGISEYPLFGKNLSILLSRADQALYSAKKDGKKRTYIFDPIMARNDRFWEYLKKSSYYFTDKKMRDSSTGLPFLHSSLENLCGFDFEIKSIGIICIKIDNISTIREILGSSTSVFFLENLKTIIKRTCESNFSTDTLISISDILSYHFIVLFPSIIDFTANKDKCTALFRKICRKINKAFSHFPIYLKFADSIIYFNKKNPRSIIGNIESTLSLCSYMDKKTSVKEDKEQPIKYPWTISDSFFKANFEIKNISNIINGIPKYFYFSAKNMFSSFSVSSRFLNTVISTIDSAEAFLLYVKDVDYSENTFAILPFLSEIDFETFIDLIIKIIPDRKIFITINELDITSGKISLSEDINLKNTNVSLILSDCFIDTEILKEISYYDFKAVILSEHLTMCINSFKDRIKILNGFKIFLDQLEIDICTTNIANSEDMQLLKDIGIIYSD